MYCGNNKKAKDILVDGKVKGTRYKCFRKGVGVGLNSPYSYRYTSLYAPIDERKIYCGKKNKLPAGYDYLGNAPQCLQKGVSIGKKLKASRTDLNELNMKELRDIAKEYHIKGRWKMDRDTLLREIKKH